MKMKKNVLTEGAIPPSFIAESISKHSTKKNIGAHSIFLGQVRNDVINEEEVQAIEYTAYREMAEKEFAIIREEAFERYDITCMHLYHSIGKVKAGEISLFVFVSSAHRQPTTEACQWVVEAIKSRVPVYGKELFADERYTWKKSEQGQDIKEEDALKGL